MTQLLVPGQLYRSPTHGLLKFMRFNTYFGETTAQFEMLEFHQGYHYAMLDTLQDIIPIGVGAK